MQQTSSRPHSRAWRVYTQHIPRVLGLLLFQLALRLVAFAPLVYAASSGKFLNFNRDYALAYGLLFSLPLYVLLVMPFRFQAAAAKAQLHGFERDSRVSIGNYLKWLPAALVRFLRALPFILPFFIFIGLYFYYMAYPDFIVPMLAISDLGNLIGMDFLGGVIIIGLAALLTSILAACGWKRDIAFEHQDILTQGIRLSLQRAAALRKRRQRTINRTVLLNLLLCLPAVLGVLIALGSYLMGLRTGALSMDFLNIATRLIDLDIPQATMLIMLIVLLVLWLPVLPWRKLALSAAVLEQANKG